MDYPEKFYHLFDGCKRAYNVRSGLPSGAAGQKHEVQITTVKDAPSVAIWKEHLHSDKNIGITPINEQNKCVFGAIDIDVYSNDIYLGIIEKLKKYNLPLIPVLSKSGGVHLLIFTSEPVSAKLMKDTLTQWGAVFELEFEVFPKQNRLSGDAVGSPIAMPYAGAFSPSPPRQRAFEESKEHPGKLKQLNIDEFLEKVEALKVSEKYLKTFVLEGYDPDAQFNGLPACLMRKLDGKKLQEGGRSNMLFNIAIYGKTKEITDMDEFLQQANTRLFMHPLKLDEIVTTKNSVMAKDFTYKGRKAGGCVFCEGKNCASMSHGRNNSGIRYTGITKIEGGDIVYWIIDLSINNDDYQIKATAAELQSAAKIQAKILDAANLFLEVEKKEEWVSIINDLLASNLTTVYIPEATGASKFISELEKWLTTASDEGDPISIGRPYYKDGVYYFQQADMDAAMSHARFRDISRQEQITVLTQQLKAESDVRMKIGNKRPRLKAVPEEHLRIRFQEIQDEME